MFGHQENGHLYIFLPDKLRVYESIKIIISAYSRSWLLSFGVDVSAGHNVIFLTREHKDTQHDYNEVGDDATEGNTLTQQNFRNIISPFTPTEYLQLTPHK